MRTIIAGSRNITAYSFLLDAVRASRMHVTAVVSGGARGVDTLGELYAANSGLPLQVFKADWDTYGRRAGFIRNIEMAGNADALIALWDGKSKGTEHMIKEARKHGLSVYVHKIGG